MEIDLHQAVLAVDGGGTRLRLVLGIGDTQLVAAGGPCNLSTDFEAGIKSIEDGLHGIARSAGKPVAALTEVPAYFGIAGVISPEIAENAKSRLDLKCVRIEEDRIAAITGALGPEDGAVAHCGTGSFLGTQTDGQVRTAGGWGSNLGDEASAHWAAKRALALTLDTQDGLFEPSDLSNGLLKDLKGVAGIIGFAGTASPDEVAKLAPRVTEAAEAGDPLARAVLHEGANYIERTLATMGWRPGLPLCLTGGIGPSYSTYLSGQCRSGLTQPRGKPIDGAMALAKQFKEEKETSCQSSNT